MFRVREQFCISTSIADHTRWRNALKNILAIPGLVARENKATLRNVVVNGEQPRLRERNRREIRRLANPPTTYFG